MSGIATTVTNQFDIREVGPMSDHELWVTLTEPLRNSEVPYQAEAINRLVKAANGDPSRLRDLADAALAYADPDAGITTAAGIAATGAVNRRYRQYYQDYWNISEDPENAGNDEQKDLLAAVAAQGPNGLSMPAAYQAKGSGHWQATDKARQILVARGLLREHDGGLVTIADPEFQVWINDITGQTPAPAAPSDPTRAVARNARPVSAIAPVHPTGEQAELASQVFGPTDQPVYRIHRTDDEGRPISLDELPPRGTSIMFTGPPGMGTSYELDNVHTLARRQGWMAFRVDASQREELGFRVVRAINQDLEKFRARFGDDEAAKLKNLAGELAVRTRSALTDLQLRVGVPGVAEVGVNRRADDAPKDNVGSTLNELADYLGALAEAHHEPILMTVDNLDCAKDDDLVRLTELSARLQERAQPMFLIGAGGELAATRLAAASGGASGIETKVTHRFDIRKVAPVSDDQLRRALTVPLYEAGIRHEPQAVDALVKAANGNPSRLRTLAGAALGLGGRQPGITTDIANATTAQLNLRSRLLYDAAWYGCDAAEKDLLARTAGRGAHGLSLRDESGPGNWSLDNASNDLISRGLLRQNGRTVSIADPGLQEWIQTRLGQSAATAGIARPTGRAPQPQLSSGERPTKAHERASGRPSQVNR
jgi:hypothetical protein